VPPVSTNEFRNGMHIELDGQTWRIVEFQHVKPGKGGAFVRTKLKSLDSGSVVDRTFRAGEKFERVFTENKNMQYLYDSGDEVVFMDEETYEQLSIPRASGLQLISSTSYFGVPGAVNNMGYQVDEQGHKLLKAVLEFIKTKIEKRKSGMVKNADPECRISIR